MARNTPPVSPVSHVSPVSPVSHVSPVSPVPSALGTYREELIDSSQSEILRLKEENLFLSLSREDLVKQLGIERVNLSSFREHIQINKKAVPSDTSSPSNETPLPAAFLTQCDVARLEAEKASLECELKEQNRKIESLTSELECQRTENANKSAELEQYKFDCSKLTIENERLPLSQRHSTKEGMYPRNHSLRDTQEGTRTEELDNQLLQFSYGDLLTRINLLEKENEHIRRLLPQESRWNIDKKRITEMEQSTRNLTVESKPVQGREFGVMDLGDTQQNLKSETEMPPLRHTKSAPSSHKYKSPSFLYRPLLKDFIKPEPNKALRYNMYNDQTPAIFPIPNPTTKSPRKIHFREPLMLSVVKLKYLCGFTDKVPIQQVICLINKRYELGQLMGVFELETRMDTRYSFTHYAGISLYNPVGDSNGEFRGTRLFQCEENCATVIPYDEVLVPVF